MRHRAEGRRCFLCHADERAQRAGSLFIAEICGVDRDEEIGAAAQFIRRILLGISRLIPMRARHHREMPARRKAEYADAFCIDAPLARVLPHHPHSTLRILQRRGMWRVLVATRHAILQYARSDADRVQPLGDLRSLLVPGEMIVAAARADDHRRTICLVGGRSEKRERRLSHEHAADHGILRRCRLWIRRGRFEARLARDFVRPQLHLLAIVRREAGKGDEQRESGVEQGEFHERHY